MKTTGGIEHVAVDPRALGEMLKGPNGVIATFLSRLCIKAQHNAMRYAPVDTGRLRASIAWSIEEEGDSLVGYVGSNVEYAIYQELGTQFMAPQPYLWPGVYDAATDMGLR